MKVAVTGANGFLGKNLLVALQRQGVSSAPIDVHSGPEDWASAVTGAHAVFHLAGVNRSEGEHEFAEGNVGSLVTLFAALSRVKGDAPLIVLSSSMQAGQDNPYGKSKLAAEGALEAYAVETGTPAVIYRLPGVFGKWCRPNYNSVVATFCHNIARDLPVSVADPSRMVHLVHVDDVVAAFVALLDTKTAGVSRPDVGPVFTISLADLARQIQGFRGSRQTLLVPDVDDAFTRRLLGTYTSYIPPGDLAYPLEQRTDTRGTLAELLRSPHFGQMFVSRTHRGITRGNHYHDLKVEKFCVLEGEAIIRFRPVLGDEVIEHRVSGVEFRVVDIPPGMTHSIENVGTGEMVVLFWASEILNQQRPDTHYLEVLRA